MYSGEDAPHRAAHEPGRFGHHQRVRRRSATLVHDMCRAYLDGDVERARDIRLPVSRSSTPFSEVNPIPVKEAPRPDGYDRGQTTAMPLCPMADDTRSALTDALKGLVCLIKTVIMGTGRMGRLIRTTAEGIVDASPVSPF